MSTSSAARHRNRFGGLMSRWSRPASCASASDWHAWLDHAGSRARRAAAPYSRDERLEVEAVEQLHHVVEDAVVGDAVVVRSRSCGATASTRASAPRGGTARGSSARSRGSRSTSGRIELDRGAAARAAGARRATPRPCRRRRAARRAGSCRARVARASAERASLARRARPARRMRTRFHASIERDARPRSRARRPTRCMLERSSRCVGAEQRALGTSVATYQSSGAATPARLPPIGATDARYVPSVRVELQEAQLASAAPCDRGEQRVERRIVEVLVAQQPFSFVAPSGIVDRRDTRGSCRRRVNTTCARLSSAGAR